MEKSGINNGKGPQIENKEGLKVIGYADSIVDGKLNKITTSPNEDTIFEILQNGNVLKLNVWSGAEKRICARPSFLEGTEKQVIGNQFVNVEKLGELRKDSNGVYCVSSSPEIVISNERPEEKTKKELEVQEERSEENSTEVISVEENKIVKTNKNQEQSEESGATGGVDNQISKEDFEDFVKKNKKEVVENTGLDKVKINSVDNKEKNEEKDELEKFCVGDLVSYDGEDWEIYKIRDDKSRLLSRKDEKGEVDEVWVSLDMIDSGEVKILGKIEIENGNKEDSLIEINGEDENIQISPEKMRTLEEVLAGAETKRALQLESSKFKNGIIKGLDKWENFGQGEEGLKGFGKRFTKTAINLALIGAISSISVEKLAEAGIGSATALGGGITSYFGRKMATGLGLGAIMEIGGKNIPDKIKKWMPEIMAVGGVALALSGGGFAVAGASVLGYLSSKFIEGRFTNEKIENRQAKAKENLIENYKNENGEIDLEDLNEIELEYQEILKKYENQRIWGKLADGATKLGMASLVSGLTLEASGLVRDNIPHTNTESNLDNTVKENTTKADSTVVKSEVTESVVSKNDTISEVKVEPTDSTVVNNPTSHVASGDNQNTIQDNLNNTEVKQEIDQMVVVHKGEGIEHAFIRQIENDQNLAKELGYEGDLSDTKALHEFAGREAHVIAIKSGYVDNSGHEIRVSEAEKIGYEIKIEGGSVIVNEKNIDGSIIETHNEGDKFESNLEKGEYVKGGDLNKSNDVSNDKIIESNEFKGPEQINPSSNQNIDVISYTNEAKLHELNIYDQANASEDIFKITQEISLLENTPHDTVEYQNLHDHIIEMQKDITKNYGDILNTDKINSDISNIDQGTPDIHSALSQEQLARIEEVGERNINHIFYNKNELWNSISRDVSADRLFELGTDGVKPEYQPLISYMDKLHEISGLSPMSESLINEAESIPHYINRTLEKIEQMGMLDKVKL